MEPSNGIIGGAASSSPTTGARPGTGSVLSKRKRSGTGFDSSPGTANEQEDEDSEKRKQPGVKRACNECRQQKLRCDVIQEPFTTCSRCLRLKLDCKIESNFKRVGKRSKHAEMEKQIERLQRVVAQAQQAGFIIDEEEDLQSPIANSVHQHSRNQSYIGSEEAVSSLLHLKQGGSYNTQYARQIENVGLTGDAINHLFNEFFSWYHPYLPFLSPEQTPDQYFQQDPLLFWVIITVAARRYSADPNLLTSLHGPVTRLLWSKVGEVPNNYHIVKAMILLCTWPLPISTTSSDITHILCGVMMKAATGIGLHRPNNTQDFSRVSVDLNREQLHDRVVTWAVCNIVAQSTATGYGQPASTLYDWSLAIRPGEEGPFTLSPELSSRLTIERFCDKVSKEMYNNANDPRGVAGEESRAQLTRVYRREYEEIRVAILSRQNLSPIVDLHLRAAGLHLRLSAFFDSSTTHGYLDDLMGLWRATAQFLDLVFELETPADNVTGGILKYATGYILQMIIAACFSLLKLLSSFFAKFMDFDRGRQLFHRTISAIRTMSVVNNDLPWRLAELMVQMYNGARVEQRQMAHMNNGNELDSNCVVIDDSLQLKVRCRMSMSLVFDSIWRWREEFQTQGRSIEAMRNPTNPDSANESSDSSTHLDSTLVPASHQMQNQLLAPVDTITPNEAITGANNMLGGNTSYGETNYEVFDPLNWMLDGLVDFPYSYNAVQGLEANGLS
ncbi:hypothetical protein EYC80_004107 [Monilinia laxa]|uniref:Zn(2)-C6 fungal-type domain-containing protein n=1 Tax=Monilinia laxa TaxID=61186 RepID=A0A5N6KLP4_MONLA|nr:hypothetical protein EYC80_004107 [Monilinia laxa]